MAERICFDDLVTGKPHCYDFAEEAKPKAEPKSEAKAESKAPPVDSYVRDIKRWQAYWEGKTR